MNLRKTIISTLGAFAVTAGMVGGAAAQVSAPVAVDYGCPTTAGSVAIEVNGVIDYGLDDLSGDGATVEVTLDLTCNFSSNFNVSAAIGDFTLDGPGSGNPAMTTWFGGEHFRMDNGAVASSDVVVIPGFTAVPEVQETVFAGLVTEEDAIIQDDDSTTWVPVIPPFVYLPVIGVWQASPGITVVEWDASVHFLPLNLTPGTYSAPLTVDLNVN